MKVSGLKPSNIHRGVVPPMVPPSPANLSHKSAQATKEHQKPWFSRLFILVDWGPVARNDVQAVTISNSEEDGPAAAPEEEAELKNVD